MADYTVSTNLISWIPAHHELFGWPSDQQEAELVRAMAPGDLIVPKFAQNPHWRDQDGYQRAIADALQEDYDVQVDAYNTVVQWGAGAVPFVMRVMGQEGEVDKFPVAWSCVRVERVALEHPLSTSEYLRLRAVPIELAGQFKAMAAPGRRVQALPDGAGQAIMEAGASADRGRKFFRTYTLVRAADAGEAAQRLSAAELAPLSGDRAFLVAEDSMPGVHICQVDGELVSDGQSITTRPADLKDLLTEAAQKATKTDYFKPARALQAADELAGFLASGEEVLELDEFGHFHDRYVILDSKITQALDIRQRPAPIGGGGSGGGVAPDPEGDEYDDLEDPELVDLDKLNGLTVQAVQAQLPEGMALPASVLAEAVTALRSGKHLLLSGPPGTGKSTVAGALCRAVVESRYRLATATADWTTFDTVGGYVPQSGGALAFEPGLVLRALETGAWLVIDEMNRADIDKAFGPLFTLLASSGAQAQETVLLPYRHAGKNVDIGWAPTRSQASTRYAITPAWRLLGTMNVSDKASLFQLSFAFLRRFAVIDVPLPAEPDYRALMTSRLQEIDQPARQVLIDAGIAIAFGPVPLGPAILLDIVAFTERALVATATGGSPYADAVEAFLTAARLYAVPQYEGSEPAQAEAFTTLLAGVIDQPPAAAWSALQAALDSVALAPV